MKLDYTIESPEERKKIVEQIIADNPNLSPSYLEILADYLVLCMEKQEKKQRKILTDNRLVTVNKRERSYEGLASQMESGEDGIYSLINDSKTIIFQPKISITQRDLDTMPELRQLRETINRWEKALKRSSGKTAYIIKKMLIEMRKDQYIIKQSYQQPVVPCKLTRSSTTYIPLEDASYINDNRQLIIQGVSLMSPKVISAILCDYSKLKEDSYDKFSGDTWYLIQAFEELCDLALETYPIYKKIIELKIDRLQNNEIRDALQAEFGETYSVEYISSLWRNKIPITIAKQAQIEFLEQQWEILDLPFKKCSRCGQLKPMHNLFFSKNKTSKDGYYSICKVCRNKKK